MRCVEKGAWPTSTEGQPISLQPYQLAAAHLKARIGRYCSFCERFVPVSLAVEHKLPKNLHAALAFDWSNFLLACTNCNSCKGTNELPDGHSFWPDVNDTYSTFEYVESGRIKIRPGVSEQDARAADALLALLGLDKTPAATSNADHRWDDRLEVRRQAEQSRQDLTLNDTPALRACILNTAINKGGFSIWMTVFANDADMQAALVNAFPGTVQRHVSVNNT